MFNKVSLGEVKSTGGNTNDAHVITDTCKKIRSIFTEEALSKTFSDVFNEADIYSANYEKGPDNKVSDVEAAIWIKNNIKEGVLICEELRELDVNMPCDFTKLSDEQIRLVFKTLHSDTVLGENLRSKLNPVFEEYNNAMNLMKSYGVDMQLKTVIELAEILTSDGQNLNIKS